MRNPRPGREAEDDESDMALPLFYHDWRDTQSRWPRALETRGTGGCPEQDAAAEMQRRKAMGDVKTREDPDSSAKLDRGAWLSRAGTEISET